MIGARHGELELELTIGKFRMVAMADSACVADQWAQAITSITLISSISQINLVISRPTTYNIIALSSY